LSIIISENKVQINKKKLSGVLEWPVPTKVKQVQAFLGFVNFYHRFIENFAKISKLFFNLTKKNSIWTWDKEQQNAFEVLKNAFTMAPVLRIPNDKDLFKLSTNANDFATEAVLLQKDIQTNLWHPVAFFSKSLDVHERNYKIYDKKLLVVIWGLEEYRHHLEGHAYKVEI